MPGEWDIAGSFIQGIMARQQHKQQYDMNEQAIKKAKAENALMDIQLADANKTVELVQQYMDYFRRTSPQQATIPGIAPAQALQPQSPITPPTGVSGPKQAGAFTMPQQTPAGGFPQVAAQQQIQQGQLTQGQPPTGADPVLIANLPDLMARGIRAKIYKALGSDNPEIAVNKIENLAGPGGAGGVYTQAINSTGGDVGPLRKQQPSLHPIVRENADLSKDAIFIERGNQHIVGKIQVSPPGILTQEGKVAFDNLVKNAESDPSVVDFNKIKTVMPRLNRAIVAYDETGSAGVLDDALLFAISKANDANSAVLIGEYLRTVGLQSIWDNVKGKLTKAAYSGAGLSPAYRKELITAVTQAMADKTQIYDLRMGYFRDRGRSYNPNLAQINNAFPLSSEIFPIEKPQKGKDYDREYIPGQGLK